jgi:hypothetical protein
MYGTARYTAAATSRLGKKNRAHGIAARRGCDNARRMCKRGTALCVAHGCARGATRLSATRG